MAYEVDIKSYEHRIERKSRLALAQVSDSKYREAVGTLIGILELQAALDELRYQQDQKEA